MALYSWGGGGKDKEWCMFGITFSPQISVTYFLCEEAFFGSPSVWKSFKSYVYTWREFPPGVRDMHVK